MIKIKVAVISDIHGNCVALKEVLKDAEKKNVNEYVFLGDLVNDLPFGNETLEIVRKYSNKILKGNKEQYLIEYEQNNYDWKNVQFRNVKFMYNELTEENKDFIRKLPHKLEIEYGGVKILFVHGSPKSVEEQLHKQKEDLLDKYTKNLEDDALVFGHTHEKMWYDYMNNKLILNAGCCGVSPHYNGKAEYTILDIENNKIKNIEQNLIHYDTNIVKQKIIDSGILKEDKVLMNLTFCAITGKGEIRYNFLREAKQIMKERNEKLSRINEKGIYSYFKLYDDDIWLGLAEKYKEYFVF